MAELEISTTEALASLPMFADLDEIGLWHVSELATLVEVPAGHVLIKPGQEGAGMFVIADGHVTVELAGGATIDIGPGEFIGELSLLVDGLVHTGRVRAASPVRCLAISRDDFDRLLATYPMVAVSMLRVLGRRLAATDELLQTQ
jgi:CRP-like cAMP-binding protein